MWQALDVVAKDISVPLEKQNGAIIEVNAAPGFRMHLEPNEGESQPVGEAIVDSLFEADTKGRIPIVSVTGTNGKTTTTRLISRILALQGNCVGMTSTDGVFIGDRRIDDDDCSGPASAKRVLMNPLIDSAVFETARGGILRAGLGFDKCDVGVVTNIGEGDHLGMDNVHTIEDLVQVKRVVVEAVSEDGCAVLNADDPHVAEMAEKCPGSVVWFSQNAENKFIQSRQTHDSRVVFIREGLLVLAQGQHEFPLISLDKLPITLGGKVRFQIENVLAATATTWALGVPAEILRTALETFTPDLDSNPGRFNIFDYSGATVVVDYGHNTSSLTQIIEALGLYSAQRKLAVYSTAGDRRDEDIVQQGRLLGGHFDQVFLYEGSYSRGRESGEIINLFKSGIDEIKTDHRIFEFDSWKTATENALGTLQTGDLLLIQADCVHESYEFFSKLFQDESSRR